MAHPAAKSSLIASLVAQVRRAVAVRRDRRRVRELLNLSDFMLSDIGITRFDVAHAISKPGAQLSSAALTEIVKTRVAVNSNMAGISEQFTVKAA